MRIGETLKNSRQYNKIVFFENGNIGFYFTVLVIAVGLFTTLALIVDLLRIHIYRPDSAYYIDNYLFKLESEGRWLNYLLFPITSHIPGRVAILSNLLFLFLSIFIVSNRWTGRTSYSLLLSLLIIQVAPLMEGLTWPAIPIASFLLLFLAALVSPYINLYIFYILFGVLLFGTSSFYLLPLAHLHLFKESQIGQNLKILSFQLIPAWALGFIVGFIFSLLMVYALTDEVGIQLEDWRRPNPVRGFRDLITNAKNSFDWFIFYLAELFGGFWRLSFLASAFLIGFFRVNKEVYLPAAILACGIIGVHFILTIPTGISISFRTSLAAWIGVLVIIFFYPNIKKREYYLLLPVILFMIISFYRVNHGSLKYFSAITNTYHDELVRAAPLPPDLYRGVIFLSSSDDVFNMNALLISMLDLKRGKMESINEDFHWVPVAYEAGFKRVILCGKQRSTEASECDHNYENYHHNQPTNMKNTGLYNIHGEKDGFLIISLNLGS